MTSTANRLLRGATGDFEVVVGLEVVVAVAYGLLILQAIVAFVTGGTRVAAAFNVIGLLIAFSVLRDAMGDDARAWFDRP